MRNVFFGIIALLFFTNNFYCQSASGNALNYDGSNDYVQTSNVLGISGASQRTVEFLFNADFFGATAPPSVIVHWGYVGGSSPHRQSMIGVQGTYVVADGGNDNYYSNYTFSINTWYHVAFTYNSGTIKIYINGALNGTSTGHAWNTDNTVLSVVRSYFEWPLFDGNLDEVRIWNFERTQAQIQSTMNKTLSPAYYSTADSGLVAYYRFDEGTGGGSNSGVTSLPDLSTNSLNGALYNFALSGSSSNWIVSDAPLPVELISFTANFQQSAAIKSVILNWQTATEVNNYGFEIEASTSLSLQGTEVWEKIGFVEGHGNSNSPKDYCFVDENPQGSKIKYRLKQIDTDGAFEYFPNAFGIEIELNLLDRFELLQNYPNPFNPTTTVSYELPLKSNVKIDIFNLLGQHVRTVANEIKNAGIYTFSWNAANLVSGIYVIRMEARSIDGSINFSKSIKTILLK